MKLMKFQQKAMIDELISSLGDERYENVDNQSIYDNFEKKIKILKSLRDIL
jgi:hypothetical protein